MNCRRRLSLLTLLLLAPAGARAAEIAGRVAGYVYDPTGAALSEVPLTISGSSLQQPMSRTSGDDGRYEFQNLPPGSDYTIEVEVPGFSPIKETGITVLRRTHKLEFRIRAEELP